MKNTGKRFLYTIISVLLASGMLAACASKPAGDNAADTKKSGKSNESVTLSLYGNAGDAARPYMQKIFKLYEEKTGNKIDVQGLDSSNFENVCLTKFQTGDLPDILMHFGGYSLDAYNPEQNFVDFSDARWVSDIADTSVAQTKRNGVVYGLPFWESSVSGCFYNKKIFSKLGLTVPTTQEEFDKVCQQLLDNGIQPIYMAAADSWPLLYQFGMDPIFKDTGLLNKLNSNQITYSGIPAMTKLIQWYKTSADNGYFGKNFSTDTMDYASEVLGSGEAAMMFCWDTWFDTDYDNTSYEYKSDDFGIMPVFMGTIDQGTYEGGNNSLLLVNKNSAKADAAIDFINFCADPANYNQAFDGVATAPTFKGMTTNRLSSQYKEAEESIKKLENPSIANPEIIGFSQNDGGKCIQELLVGNIDVKKCLQLMDEERIKVAASQNVEGFR